ncbi:MAG: DUF5689 domain-containing protein [Flavobacterium sp.]
MKTSIIKSIFAIVLFTTVFTSCTESDNGYDTVSKEVPTFELTTTTSVAAVIATATGTPTVYTNDDVIEAYVTSNDAGGNFYKSLSLQDVQTGGPAPLGFSVSINQSMLFERGFFAGRKVYIKLKGLAIAKVFGTMVIGHIDPTDATRINGIEGLEMADFLFPSATIVDESTLVRHMSLAAAASDIVQNTLIEIDNVQFADNSLARTYFDVDSGGVATNQDIVDAILGGRSRYCRISKFAPFSTGKVPTGRGTIRGVMTKYNSDYQFLVRSEADFKLTNPRTYNFPATLTENFSSYAATGSYSAFTSFVNFPNYLNFAPVGTKKWFVKTGGFLEMSSFGGAIENNKAYFIVPVDMTAASTMKFDLKSTFFLNSLGFKLYRTTDYVPGMKLSDATLTDISTACNQAFPAANATLTAVTYNIPATVTGNGYFVFAYVGSSISTGPAVTTTIDIDNIIIN